MKMTKEEYRRYAEQLAPRSKAKGNMLRAFVAGGLICCLGQGIFTLFGLAGLGEESAATAESISLILLGVLLTGLGVYDDLTKLGCAGTLVPITGFANSVAAPALEFKAEGIITGTAVKMFTIAGPVIVSGVTASVIYGLLLCLLGGGA